MDATLFVGLGVLLALDLELVSLNLIGFLVPKLSVLGPAGAKPVEEPFAGPVGMLLRSELEDEDVAAGDDEGKGFAVDNFDVASARGPVGGVRLKTSEERSDDDIKHVCRCEGQRKVSVRGGWSWMVVVGGKCVCVVFSPTSVHTIFLH